VGAAKYRGAATPFTRTVAPERVVGSGILGAEEVVPSVRDVPKIEKITPGAKGPPIAKLAAFNAEVICGLRGAAGVTESVTANGGMV
jgi:hypothetical protein